jgi:hypothetical protein
LSYFDIASNFLDRGPAALINGYWSPLYPFFIALAWALTGRNPLLGYFSEHVVNGLFFVVGGFAFAFFVREVSKERPAIRRSIRLLWIALCAAIFLETYFTPRFTLLGITAPDILVAAAAFTVAGLLCRIARAPTEKKWWIWLGVTLAVGYYAKSVFFPLGLAAMAIAAVAGPWSKARIRGALWCFAVWAAVCAPLVIATSLHVGRLSISESGAVNYICSVNLTRIPGADGVRLPDLAVLSHPPRVLLTSPVLIFDYRQSAAGTFPPWFEPSYWGAGIPLKPDPSGVRRQTQAAIDRYEEWFHAFYWQFGTGVLILLIPGLEIRGRQGLTLATLPALLFAAVPFLLYAAIFVDARYVAPFWAILWVVLLDAALRIAGLELPRCSAAVCAALLLITLAPLPGYVRPSLASLREFPESGRILAYHPYARAGMALREIGIPAGSNIAALGDARWHLYAQPAGLRITGQIDQDDVAKFWSLSRDDRTLVLDRLRSAGYRALVFNGSPPESQLSEGWMRLSDSYWAFPLHEVSFRLLRGFGDLEGAQAPYCRWGMGPTAVASVNIPLQFDGAVAVTFRVQSAMPDVTAGVLVNGILVQTIAAFEHQQSIAVAIPRGVSYATIAFEFPSWNGSPKLFVLQDPRPMAVLFESIVVQAGASKYEALRK